jgi:DnaJ family protein C protein 7
LDKIKKIKNHLKKLEGLISATKWEEALREIGYALDLSPQSIPFKIQKGEILLELKIFDEASKLAGSILQHDAANSSDAMFLRGKALYYMGQSQQGSSLLLQALNLDPDNIKCLTFRKKIQKIENLKKEGNDLLQSSDFEKAYEKYSEAIEIDPNANNLNSQLYSNRAAAAQKLNKHDQAILDATKAIELNPEYTKAYQRRVASYMKLEKFEEALYDLNKVKELEPENYEVKRQFKDLQKQVKAAKRKDYYKVLGVEKNATSDEIEKAYKKVAFANHPDRFPEEEKEARTKLFHDIGEAKTILMDSQKRAAYDNGADLEDINSGGGNPFGGGMGGVDISELFNMFGGMGGSRRGGGGGGHSFSFGGDEGFSPFGDQGKKKRQHKK